MENLTFVPKIYDPTINPNPLASGFLTYGQLPVSPLYVSPLPIGPTTDIFDVPSLFTTATQSAAGVTLNTNGSVFNGLVGYSLPLFIASGTKVPTGRTLSATANTGYAGFTNYTIDLTNVNPLNLGSITLTPVSPNFPILDHTQGFTLEFDLTVLQESSAAGRAGFSALIVSNDPSKSIELGFKEQGNGTDRVFAQNANFIGEGETTSLPLEIGQTKTYRVSFTGNTYSLSANGVQILTGALRDYVFNPATSNPPFPGSANPYEAKNLIFFGDNTDQARAQFTLGQIVVLPVQRDLTPDLYDDYLASHPDLIQAFGYNLAAARTHYENFGFKEGRAIDTFSEGEYIASYDDLINVYGYDPRVALPVFPPPEVNPTVVALGYDPTAVTEHYIRFGYGEGRSVTFQADEYLASYGDLIQAYGYNLTEAVRHFIVSGSKEGRSRDLFDAGAYLNKYTDLQTAFGGNLDAATRHFIEFGFAEGRSAA
ncbi:MAG: hypothetical protein ICV77_12230 [Cyanobacteria bacterium Co-bin8]|nr:hypothetical protein [Cyanobacteria bacterium Co-bin8]